MAIIFDPDKEEINRAKHGISLSRAADFEGVEASIDDRRDYGEVRYRAWGYIDGVAYFMAFTIRGADLRPISLRRAHAKEMKRYGEKN